MALVVTPSENKIFELSSSYGLPVYVGESSDQIASHILIEGLELDLGILAWWPAIIKAPLLTLPRGGFVNTHPSLLPYNRGKHYNFWALVEQAPFGVSMHFVDEGVDTGDLVAQLEIPYTWEDTGGSLRAKACDAMVQLFKETYPLLRCRS